MTTSKTPVMDALVDFVLGLELAAVPPAVVEAANRSMTDWLGTAIRGSVEPLADAVQGREIHSVTANEQPATARLQRPGPFEIPLRHFRNARRMQIPVIPVLHQAVAGGSAVGASREQLRAR